MQAIRKSAVRLARDALAVGRAALPCYSSHYSSHYSRHDAMQPRPFALPTLEQFLESGYRGLVALVAEGTELRRALALMPV